MSRHVGNAFLRRLAFGDVDVCADDAERTRCSFQATTRPRDRTHMYTPALVRTRCSQT